MLAVGLAWTGDAPVQTAESPAEVVAQAEGLPVRMASSKEALERTFSGECAARVRLVDPDGIAMEGQEVRVFLSPQENRPDRLTGPDGVAVWPGVACGSSARFSTSTEHGIYSSASASSSTIIAGETAELMVEPGVLVTGVVRGDDGQPLQGATVGHSKPTVTGPDGRYEQRVGRNGLNFLRARAPGHHSEFAEVVVPEGVYTAELDFDLKAGRHLTVWCRDGEKTGCFGTHDLSCRSAGSPPGGFCDPVDDSAGHQFICECGDGEGVVRTATLQVEFGPDDTEVELAPEADIRVRGRLVLHGKPVRGHLFFRRVLDPDRSIEDAFSSLFVDVPANGVLDTADLAPGRWALEASGRSDGEFVEKNFDELVLVDGSDIQLGDLELSGAGAIEGVVHGAGEDDERMTMVFAEPANAETPGTQMMETTGPTGRFKITSLAAGQWRVWEMRDPSSAVLVDVEADIITDGVALTLSEDWVLPGIGAAFDISMTADNGPERFELVSVEPGGPAEQAGLEAGDVVVDMTLDGRPETEAEHGTSLAMYTLITTGRSDGIHLTVDRDGEQVAVHF